MDRLKNHPDTICHVTPFFEQARMQQNQYDTLILSMADSGEFFDYVSAAAEPGLPLEMLDDTNAAMVASLEDAVG